jgi:CheY-like chemotaxis protein
MITVLLVEDEGLPRWIMRRALESAACAVEEAETCQAALDTLANQTFDLVLLDYRLPDGTGLDVAREYRQRGGSATLVFLTAEAERITGDDIARLAIAKVLTKPVKSEDLMALIALSAPKVEGVPAPVPTVVGRFRLMAPGADVHGVADPATRDEWLALDLKDVAPSAAGLRRLQEIAKAAVAAGSRLCLIGATPGLRAILREVSADAGVEYANDLREVESLSRRLCAEVERRLVMSAAVRRELI